jgi:hypothetical protein
MEREVEDDINIRFCRLASKRKLSFHGGFKLKYLLISFFFYDDG